MKLLEMAERLHGELARLGRQREAVFNRFIEARAHYIRCALSEPLFLVLAVAQIQAAALSKKPKRIGALLHRPNSLTHAKVLRRWNRKYPALLSLTKQMVTEFAEMRTSSGPSAAMQRCIQELERFDLRRQFFRRTVSLTKAFAEKPLSQLTGEIDKVAPALFPLISPLIADRSRFTDWLISVQSAHAELVSTIRVILLGSIPSCAALSRELGRCGISRPDLMQSGLLGMLRYLLTVPSSRPKRASKVATEMLYSSMFRQASYAARRYGLIHRFNKIHRRILERYLLLCNSRQSFVAVEEAAEDLRVQPTFLRSLLESLDRKSVCRRHTKRAYNCLYRLPANDAEGAESAIRRDELSAVLSEMLEALPARKSAIIRMTFGIGMPKQCMGDIGERLGVTGAAISAIVKSVLTKLRKRSKASGLVNFI